MHQVFIVADSNDVDNVSGWWHDTSGSQRAWGGLASHLVNRSKALSHINSLFTVLHVWPLPDSDAASQGHSAAGNYAVTLKTPNPAYLALIHGCTRSNSWFCIWSHCFLTFQCTLTTGTTFSRPWSYSPSYSGRKTNKTNKAVNKRLKEEYIFLLRKQEQQSCQWS